MTPATGRLPLPAPRLALLAALGVLLLLPAAGGHWAWFTGYNLLLGALAAADWLLAPRAAHLLAARQAGPVLSVGRTARVALALAVAGGRQAPRRLELLDDLTPGLAEPAWPLPAAAPGEAHYEARCVQRGDQVLGPLHGCYRSPLGLWVLRCQWPVRTAVKVYPDLVAARDWELALRVRQPQAGARRVRHRHGGTELESLREYQPGDTLRAVNWAASARRGRLIVNEYQAERSQPVLLVLDCGRQMSPWLAGRPRLDHALEAGLLLGWVSAAAGDRVGLLLLGAQVDAWIPPRPGRPAVARLLAATYALQPQMAEPDYAGGLAYLRARHPKRALVCLLTDLGDPLSTAAVVRHCTALAREHLVLVVAQQDPELLRMARALPEGAPEAYRKAAALEALARREQAKGALQQAGALVVDVPPGQLSAAVVNRYLELKQAGRI